MTLNPHQTFPVSAGLLDPRHVQTIGRAVWVYLWFLNRVTRDEQRGAGDFVGLVLNGRPVSIDEIAEELGIDYRTCRRHLARLIDAEYVLQKKTGAGTCTYAVTKSKKWAWKRRGPTGTKMACGSPNPQTQIWPVDADPQATFDLSTGQIWPVQKEERARDHRKTQRSKPSPDGVAKKPTSSPTGSKVRGRGESLSKSSHRSGESSTDRGKENSAGAPAAKLSSPGELILIPPESSPKENRHASVERFIKSTYQEANDGVECAWNGRAGKALKDFLAEHSSSSWPIEKITQCVTNRFKSEGASLSADPHSWISDLASFLQGPKDRFGKTRADQLAAAPKTKAPRAVVDLPPPTRQPENDALIQSWTKKRIERVQ